MARRDDVRALTTQRRAQQAANAQAAQKKREALLAARAQGAEPGARVRVDASKGTVAVSPVPPSTTSTSTTSAPTVPPPPTPPAAEPSVAPVMALAPTFSEPERVVVDASPVEIAPLEPEPPPAPPAPEGLSTGAKVVLGVGTVAAAATVVALVVRR